MLENRKPPVEGDPLSEHSEFVELCNEAIALAVNVGIIDSVSERWPEEIQENWLEHIRGITGRLSREIGEVQDFASSFD